MSRLQFAPKLSEIEITDIKRGLGVFTPKPDRPVSFAALKTALKKAGYALDSAEIVVAGTLRRDGDVWRLVAEPSGQSFALEGAEVGKVLAGYEPGARAEVTGDWKTVGAGVSAREVIAPRAAKEAGDAPQKSAAGEAAAAPPAGVRFVPASFGDSPASHFSDSLNETEATEPPVAAAAPIRVTSPGLTVYKGGALTPRLFLVEQHLGGLSVSRQVFQLGVSYTPSQRTQIEIEMPVSRTSFDDGAREGSGVGIGNVTAWAKYRFFRKVKTYGDRQASARFGLELPTGNKDAPTAAEVNAPAFVRQQLTPISGGLSPHFDVSFSQAGGRLIFGGNVEGIVRSERGGFRVGHEVRVNTDLEYILLPFKYEQPGGELFLILESSFVHRGRGRLDGTVVEGSKATEYYLAPGLQYAAHTRFVVEGSVQFPLVLNTGPLALRNDRNILLGVKYLF